MPSRFDWETEEELLWAEKQGTGRPTRRLYRRLLLSVLFVSLILTGGTHLILQQIDRQVEEVSASVADDIISSQQLWQEAIRNADIELFDTVLSGSRPDWTAAQHALFKGGLLQNRLPLDLAVAGSPQVTDVIVSPDLTEAEVILEQQYVTSIHAPDTINNIEQVTSLVRGKRNQATITLAQILVFRRGRNRWLYSPPRREFWGDWQTAKTRHLTLSYPHREAELAERLLHDLEKDVQRMCATLPGINCRQDLHLRLRLDSNPQSLFETADPTIMLGSTAIYGLNLPAPSLVGIPVDEAAYQALMRSYSAHVVAAAITMNVDWRCCSHGLLYQALLDRQLAQLGLRYWPLEQSDYQTALSNSTIGVFDMQALWRGKPVAQPTGPATLLAYAMVDYLTKVAPDKSIASMQRRLNTTDSYWLWLQKHVPTTGRFRGGIQRDWLRYVASHLEQTPAPIPFPNQNIELLCDTGNGDEATLLRYNPTSEAWVSEIADRSFVFMNPLPDDDGVILQERQSRPDRSRVLLWQNGQETDAFGKTVSDGIFRTTPGGQDLVLFSVDYSQNRTLFRLLSYNQCDRSGCIVRSLLSPTVWSPDGQKTIVRTGKKTLWVGDAMARFPTYLGIGQAPFWHDDDTAGYVHTEGRGQDAESNIVLTSLSNSQTQFSLPVEALYPHLPDGVQKRNLSIRSIKVSPAFPDLLLIAAAIIEEEGNSDDGGLLFSYDLHSEEVTLLVNLPYNLRPYDEFSFSPDGEWLTVKSSARSSSRSQLHLHHLAGQGTIVLNSTYPFGFPGYDWSKDGQWLLHTEAGFLHLFAPDHGYQRLVVHEYPSCNFAAWIDKE